MSSSDDETQIRFLMREILRAFQEHDVTALEAIFAEDFTFSDPAGPVVSKQQWLSEIASGDLRFDTVEAGEPTIQHLGDQVLVQGEARLSAHYSKSNYNGKFRYMGVYIKQGDEWKLVLTSAEREAP